jgi:hypothetical protein
VSSVASRFLTIWWSPVSLSDMSGPRVDLHGRVTPTSQTHMLGQLQLLHHSSLSIADWTCPSRGLRRKPHGSNCQTLLLAAPQGLRSKQLPWTTRRALQGASSWCI